jgi:flagellar biosynthesis anti-sigma factor FlgM
MDEMRVRNAGAPAPITPIAGHVRRTETVETDDGADETGISDRARELARAREVVEAAPEDRELRIKALRASIQNGSYQLDASEVARRLIDNGF